MTSNDELSIALLARDKMSPVPSAVEMLLDVYPGAEVLVVDIGHPESIRSAIDAAVAAADAGERVRVIEAARFANTNAAWNAAMTAATGSYLMTVENDVAVGPGVAEELIGVVSRGYDVAVPRILEQDGSLHFDPVVSRIDEVEGGVHSKLVRRPEDGQPPLDGDRRIAHLEKHCFLTSMETARRLAPFDEQMHCRTDIDVSMQCRARDLRIGFTPDAQVSFSRNLDVAVDRDLFAHRWDTQATEFANRRLVEKWHLVDYRSSVAFALKMQAHLAASVEAAGL